MDHDKYPEPSSLDCEATLAYVTGSAHTPNTEPMDPKNYHPPKKPVPQSLVGSL